MNFNKNIEFGYLKEATNNPKNKLRPNKSHNYEMHIVDLNATFYNNPFLTNIVLDGFRNHFNQDGYEFFARLNKHTGNVAIFVGSNNDLSHMKDIFTKTGFRY